MKKWGLLVSAYYVFTVLALFWPFLWVLIVIRYDSGNFTWPNILDRLAEVYGSPWFAIPVAVVFLGQLFLLFLSIDTSHRRLKPRSHIAVPATLTGLFLAVLGSGILTSLLLAIYKDNFFDYLDKRRLALALYLLLWPVLWIVWTVVFYLYAHNDEHPISRALSWILKGSIVEFLVVVPCHVIVRRRQDCCAPAATSLGLCVGLATMLIAFGPSILLLYRKRLASYVRPSR